VCVCVCVCVCVRERESCAELKTVSVGILVNEMDSLISKHKFCVLFIVVTKVS